MIRYIIYNSNPKRDYVNSDGHTPVWLKGEYITSTYGDTSDCIVDAQLFMDMTEAQNYIDRMFGPVIEYSEYQPSFNVKKVDVSVEEVALSREEVFK